MRSVSWTLLLLVVLSLLEPSTAFFGWFNRKAADRSVVMKTESAPDPSSLPRAPFEMTTMDEKFLAEAKHLELSPLDSCHYKVVNQLRASCTEMSEEEMAKLGVSLFNCQAEVEQRKTYPCTEDMSLAECTMSMDPDTWNAYHIVSNRARSVCYATRQLHFRRRTELTVNTLVSTAMSQLEAMQILKEGQEELKELTSESLEKVVSSQNELLNQQEQLQSSQEKMETSITSNLEKLAEEKALIASGHQLVAQLIESITKKMENVSSQLVEQDTELQEGHRVILADLTEVRNRSHEVYSKIESNLALFLAHQNKTALYYDVLMEKLHRMNQSLGLVLYAMDHMHRSVEQRLSYIQGFISWAGGNLNAIYTCVLHGGYFLLVALLMTFLQTPGFSRAALLILVLVNAVSELNHHVSLGFWSLSVFLVCTVIGNWMLLNFIQCLVKVRSQKCRAALPPAKPTPVTVYCKSVDEDLCTSTPEMPSAIFLQKEELKLEESSFLQDESFLVDPCKDDSIISPVPHGRIMQQSLRKTPSHSTPVLKLRRLSITNSLRVHESPARQQVEPDKVPKRHLGAVFDTLSESGHYSFNGSMSSNTSLSTSSPRPLCQAITKAGQPCRNKASGGQEFCRVHASGQMSYTSS